MLQSGGRKESDTTEQTERSQQPIGLFADSVLSHSSHFPELVAK